MKTIPVFVLLLTLCLSTIHLHAHQPFYVMDQELSKAAPFEVRHPKISQVFYGELNGQSEYFHLAFRKAHELYVNILVPDIDDYRHYRFLVEIADQNFYPLDTLDGTQDNWESFYEPFGRDHYLKGPDLTLPVPEGFYYLRVFNAGMQGRYALVTGKREWFGLQAIIRTIRLLPKLDCDFFNKEQQTVLKKFGEKR